jgi:ABC-type sugar transport system permease subunit
MTSSTRSLPAKNNQRGNLSIRKTGLIPIYLPYLFLVPALILLIIFLYYPALSAIYHSFTKWNITSPGEWIGLQNYQRLFEDPIFMKSITNILIYTLGQTFLITVMSLVGAELVYNLRNQISQSFWRLIFTLPIVIPFSVQLLIWKQIYAGRRGLLNELLVGLNLIERPIAWVGDPDTALGAIIFIGFPMISGFAFLVFLAALQNLPTEVNDAAMIDGCTTLRRILAIDLPAIRGPLALILILSLNSGMQQFAPMLVVTQGGPINSTMSPGLYLYTQAFQYGDFGYSTAIGTVLMGLTFIFSFFILRARYKGAHDVTV